MKRTLLVAVLALAIVSVSSCSSDPMRSGTADVRILLTDAPIDLSTVSAVNVTITAFLLYPADEGEGSGVVVDLPTEGDLTLNLLDYQNGATTVVADGEIPPGDYARLRMIVSAAELVYDDDGDGETPEVTAPIFNPSGKVDIPIPFTVNGGEEVEITVDFDAEGSVQVNETNGNHEYILRPVVTPVGMTIE